MQPNNNNGGFWYHLSIRIKQRRFQVIILCLSTPACLSVSLGVHFCLFVILFTIFCETLYLQSHVSFVCEKNNQGPREFTFEAVLDGLNYKKIWKRTSSWGVCDGSWTGVPQWRRCVELWTTRYIIEIFSLTIIVEDFGIICQSE